MADLANIKLKKNHSINFNFNRNDKVKKLLILGNTIHFFGFSENNKLDLMSMNDNDRNHLMWLIYQLKTNKTEIYIIGEAEEKEHYINLFNSIGSQFYIKINWKYLETKEPKDYLEKLSLLKNMKFDYIVGNPPYNAGANSGFKSGEYSIESDIVNRMNKICKKQIMVYPFTRWGKREKLSKENSTNGHLVSLKLYDAYKVFGVTPQWKYVAVYYYDNTNLYKTTKVNLDNYDYEIESYNNYNNVKELCLNLSNPYFNISPIINKLEVLYKNLINKYNTMVNDGHGFIYEENRFKAAAKYGINRKAKIQKKLARVKTYLKEGVYKYCLYKGSFNHDYDEVQEWVGQDPDKLFNGQICWLCNDKNIKENIKYWMNSPLFDVWRKYKFGGGGGVADGTYGNIPALPFNMNEEDFQKFVNNLYIFTEEDKIELRKINIHNIDNEQYYRYIK